MPELLQTQMLNFQQSLNCRSSARIALQGTIKITVMQVTLQTALCSTTAAVMANNSKQLSVNTLST